MAAPGRDADEAGAAATVSRDAVNRVARGGALVPAGLADVAAGGEVIDTGDTPAVTEAAAGAGPAAVPPVSPETADEPSTAGKARARAIARSASAAS